LVLINGYLVQVYQSSSAFAPTFESAKEALIPIAKVTSPNHPLYVIASRMLSTAKKSSVKGEGGAGAITRKN
jgi:hypothetical protein